MRNYLEIIWLYFVWKAYNSESLFFMGYLVRKLTYFDHMITMFFLKFIFLFCFLSYSQKLSDHT